MSKKRRRLLKNTMGNSYVENGLVFWIDGILNRDSQSVVDQTNNYSVNIMEGELNIVGNQFSLNRTRFSALCGDAVQGSYTVSITFQKYTTNVGTVWYFGLLNTSLHSVRAGYYGSVTTTQKWQINGLITSKPNANDLDLHTIDYVVSTETNKIYIYCDGELLLSIDCDSSSDSRNISPNASLIIGGNYNSDKHWSYIGLNCCKLYNKALSADEIRQNYNVDKSRFNF